MRRVNVPEQTTLPTVQRPRPLPLSVPCYMCGADVNECCRTATGEIAVEEHASRYRRAQLAATPRTDVG